MSAEVYGQSTTNATCYPPELGVNATTGVCCFESLQCAEQVCESQYDLLNATVNRAYGTNFCYLSPLPANISYYTFENETCLGTAMVCRERQFGRGSPASVPNTFLMGGLTVLCLLATMDRHR